LALTQKIRRNDDYRSKKDDGEIRLVANNSKGGDVVYNSSDNHASLLLKSWYGINTNIEQDNAANLLNNFFSKYNYFDTKGAYRFALNDSGKNDQSGDGTDIMELLSVNDKYLCHVEIIKEFTKQINYSLENLLKTDVALKTKIDKLRTSAQKPQQNKLTQMFLSMIEESKFSSAFLESRNFEKLLSSFNKSDKMYIYMKIIENVQNQIKEAKKVQAELEKVKSIESEIEQIVEDNINDIEHFFLLLSSLKDFAHLTKVSKSIFAIKTCSKDEMVSIAQMSTGQRVCLALAILFTMYRSNRNAPNFIILDEPMANLDTLHVLNLLDVLRSFALNGTQIFFSTANKSIAQLFVRKFRCFESEFSCITCKSKVDGNKWYIEDTIENI